MVGSAAPEAAGGERRLLAAVGLTGSAALLTVVFGVATTKIIALTAGPAGIALMGLYRYLGALASRPLLLGLDTTLVQRISTARDPKTSSETVGAAFLAVFLQGILIAGIGLGLVELLARWLFGTSPTEAQILEIRVVLAMAYANLIMQIMNAALSGRVEFRKVAVVGTVAAAVTLVSVYPLLQLGNLGLAFNVGSGSTAGAALATFYVFRIYGASSLRAPLADRFRALSAALARSAFLIVHPLVMMFAMVSVQSLILGQHALPGLGAYNAAMTMLDTALLVIMSSARTFFLPELGQLEDEEDKVGVVNRVLRLSLILGSAATLIAIAGGSFLIPFLFSDRFDRAIEILPPFSLALVGQSFVWTYAMFYLHKARYRLFFSLDLIWAVAYVGATALVVSGGGSLTGAAWAYAASYLLSGMVYTTVAVRAFGWRMLNGENLRLSAMALFGTLGACLLHDLGLLLVDLVILGVGLGAAGWALRRSWVGARATEVA